MAGFFASLIFVFTGQAYAAGSLPAQAKRLGYIDMTFSSTFSNHNIDTFATEKKGFKWYLWNYFGKNAKPSKLKFNHDHTLTLLGGPTGPNGEIATAASVDDSSQFVGTAFGGGGYFEAELKFDPDDVKKANFVGHPSFWSMAIEHLVGYGNPKGTLNTKRFEHFIEVDFFEYDLKLYQEINIQNVYGGALHDWYGVWKKTCSNGFCGITTDSIKKWIPQRTNLNQFHLYGFLWVPATLKHNGYAQYYFDNKPVGNRIKWKELDFNADPRSNKYSPFSILDHQHLVLILGTGIGEPMTVKSVRVFQRNKFDDLFH